MDSCDVVDLSHESPDDDCEIIADDYCSILKIDLQTEDITPEFAEFVKKCLKIENSKGMARILKRSLLCAYKEASSQYTKSSEFNTLLVLTNRLIDRNHNLKFSHIKVLCESLKMNKKKKRAELITLGPCSDRTIEKIRHNSFKKRKRKHIEIIDLERIESEDSTSTNGENYSNTLIDLSEEKENECLDSNLPVEIEDDLEILDEQANDLKIVENRQSNPKNLHDSLNNNLSIVIDDTENEVPKRQDENLLVVQKIENVDTEYSVELKIKQIESEIGVLQAEIEKLEETEVDDNSFNSPYVRSELLKEKVVILYTELCRLTDSQPVKRHEIHMTVLKGHPEGPTRILENLLNSNLRSNGYPPFPTFNEVKKCVAIANQKYDLGWQPARMFQEASTLFTQCGRAIQKLRQQREWGHLLSRVKRERCDEDPAEQNQDLMERLNANKEIAIKKENDILDMFADLEKDYKHKHQGKVSQRVQNEDSASQNKISIENSESSDDSGSESDIVWGEYESIMESELFKPIPIKEESACELDSVIVKTESEVNEADISKQFNELGDGFTMKIMDIKDPFVIVEISDSSDDELL